MIDATTTNALPPDFPESLARDLSACLDWLADYREAIARGRQLDIRFGGEGRYVDDMRAGRRRGLLAVAGEVREFVRLGREIGEDPIAILKALESGRSRVERVS